MSQANQSRASPAPRNLRQAVLTTDVAALAEGGEPPHRIPLHPYGTFRGNGKDFVFDETSLAAIRAQQADRGVDWVLDWHHQTLQQEEGLRDDAPAAGWITDIEVENGWVYGVVSDWTPKAALAVVEKAYRFVSAVFRHSREGRVLYYHSFGLVNRPGTHYQRMIGLSADTETVELELEPPSGEKEEPMDERLKALLTALGLAEDATQEQTTEALSALQGRAALGDQTAEIAGLSEVADTAKNRGVLMALAQQGDNTAELASLTAELEEVRGDRTERLVTQALSVGKITAPQKDYWLGQAKRDYAGAQAYLNSAPQVVPVESLADAVKPDTQTAKLEQGQEDINKLLGVDVEAFKKYNGGD